MKRRRFFQKNKEFFIILIGIFLFFNSFHFISGDVATNISVADSPPILIESIPDQSWPSNTNLLEAFDLDDYFLDPNGDEINFSHSSVEDIDIIINPSTNLVSFYPDKDFIGEKSVTFYARDGSGNTSSNPVALLVGLDNVSPTWSSPGKSKGNVYQNDYINFTMVWEDNLQLQSYTLSVKQGSGSWVDYVNTNFSGVYNTSIYEIQISANAGNTVEWKFYAWDTSGNMNVSDNQSFVIQEAEGTEGPPPSEEERVYGGFGARIAEAAEDLDLTPSRRLKDFKLSVFDFKLSLKQGTSRTVVLKISNIGTEELSLNIVDTGLLNFVVFSETEFEVLPGNSKEITIDFNIPRSAYPGQYFGFINVNSIEVNKTIPVVLDIQQVELDYDIVLNISEDYKTVRPGKEVVGNIHIYNIKDLFQTNVTLYYALKDYTGIIYNFSEEKINFSTSFVTNRSLQVPLGIPEGKYIFYARASDDKNIAIDSDFFFVGERFTFSAFFKSNLIFFFIILLSIFLAIFMVKYQKDRRKERVLHLYMQLTKLKNLIKQGKTKQALELFLRIKTQYKEPLSQEILQDKEKLKKELLKLYEVINPEALKKIQEQEKQEAAVTNKSTSQNNSSEKTQENPKQNNVNQEKKETLSSISPTNQDSSQKNIPSQKISPPQIPLQKSFPLNSAPQVKKIIQKKVPQTKDIVQKPKQIKPNTNPAPIVPKVLKKSVPIQNITKSNVSTPISKKQNLVKKEVKNEKK